MEGKCLKAQDEVKRSSLRVISALMLTLSVNGWIMAYFSQNAEKFWDNYLTRKPVGFMQSCCILFLFVKERQHDTTPSLARVHVVPTWSPHSLPQDFNPKNFPFKEQSCCNSSAKNTEIIGGHGLMVGRNLKVIESSVYLCHTVTSNAVSTFGMGAFYWRSLGGSYKWLVADCYASEEHA